jgi:hypothetical protein
LDLFQSERRIDILGVQATDVYFKNGCVVGCEKTGLTGKGLAEGMQIREE